MKKIPMRMCALTREKLEKRELFRIVRTPEHEVKVDDTYKLNGRGVYLKKDKEVIEKARKESLLDKILEVKVNDEIYDELINKL